MTRRLSRLRLLPLALSTALIAWNAGTALAAGAEIQRGGESWSGTADDLNICGWPSTFVSSGSYRYVVVETDAHLQITYHEVENYVVTIHDEEGVPDSVRGLSWRGRNEESFTVSANLGTDQVIQRSVQTAFEGPFRSQIERITLHVSADGTVVRDDTVTRWFATASCEQFA